MGGISEFEAQTHILREPADSLQTQSTWPAEGRHSRLSRPHDTTEQHCASSNLLSQQREHPRYTRCPRQFISPAAPAPFPGMKTCFKVSLAAGTWSVVSLLGFDLQRPCALYFFLYLFHRVALLPRWYVTTQALLELMRWWAKQLSAAGTQIHKKAWILHHQGHLWVYWSLPSASGVLRGTLQPQGVSLLRL